MKRLTAFTIASVCFMVGGLAFMAGGTAVGLGVTGPAFLYMILALRAGGDEPARDWPLR